MVPVKAFVNQRNGAGSSAANEYGGYGYAFKTFPFIGYGWAATGRGGESGIWMGGFGS